MKDNIYFKVNTPINLNVRTTKEYWNYLITVKHQVMEGKEAIVKSVLSKPDEIRRSKGDKDILLFYKQVDKLYCVVVKQDEDSGFIVTAYPADKLKEGEVVWIK